MRDYLLLSINGERHEVRSADALLTLSDYLRRRLGLTSTKIVCSEGDCGACTVLLGRPRDGRVVYEGVDSCILFMHQLDRTHVVTVEGLSSGGQLHPVQQAMVDCFGSQCGFCTPGFVAAMVAERESPRQLGSTQAEWQLALTGNLCRCTGYVQILEAAAACRDLAAPLEDLFPSRRLIGELGQPLGDGVEDAVVITTAEPRPRTVLLPTTVAEAIQLRSRHRQGRIVNGATDVGVQTNKRMIDPQLILSLANVRDGREIVVDEMGVTFGIKTTWTDIERWAAVALPEFHQIIIRFGSPQIRNVSTLVGNIANGSPIGDSLPLLYVMSAKLILKSVSGTRRIDINDFYRGYKQLDLNDDELITSVQMPLPATGELLKLYKISKRNDLDISTFTAAIRLLVPQHEIEQARIAMGGVGPTVLRMPATEAFLVGKTLSEATVRAAGQIAGQEIQPISDVRGSAEYRRQLAENILVKFFQETVANG